MNAYFASDAMILKVRDLGSQLQTLGDSMRAEQVIAKNEDSFVTILGGAVGVGGIYGFWQRIKSLLRGEKYDPRHGSLT